MIGKIKSVYDGTVIDVFNVWRESAGEIDAVRAVGFGDGKWIEVLVQTNDARTGTCVVNYVPAETELTVQPPLAEPSGETRKNRKAK